MDRCRAAYAADLSTLLGSLPEKAPPPTGIDGPYASTTIFLPVRPVSPAGPPFTNDPDGFKSRIKSSDMCSDTIESTFYLKFSMSISS